MLLAPVSNLLIQLKLAYGLFELSNMHSTLNFCPGPARKEKKIEEKLRTFCPNIHSVGLVVELCRV
jgi:hypothetical protein